MFNWAWYTGMLRSSEEYDLSVARLSGRARADGRPCNVTMYRSDISYQTSGERIRITGTRPNGQSCSTIEVLSGAYAWNEDIQGAELVPGKGKATPMPATVGGADDSPVGRPAGRIQGRIRWDVEPTVNDAQAAAARSRCDDDRQNVRRMGWQQASFNVPDPGCPRCHGDRDTRRQVHGRERRGETRREHLRVNVSDYKDWNNPLNPADALIHRAR